MVLPFLYTLSRGWVVKYVSCEWAGLCELQAAMSCELGARHFDVSCSCELDLLYYAPFFELRRAAFVKTLKLGP
jgi:hypothetical protein